MRKCCLYHIALLEEFQDVITLVSGGVDGILFNDVQSGYEHHRVQRREHQAAKHGQGPTPPHGPQPGAVEHKEWVGEGEVHAAEEDGDDYRPHPTRSTTAAEKFVGNSMIAPIPMM